MRRSRSGMLVVAALGCALAAGPAAAGKSLPPRHRSPAEIVKNFVEKHPNSVELVHFGNRQWRAVRVARGGGWTPAKRALRSPPATGTVETVRFPGEAAKPVAIVRGPSEAAAGAAPRAQGFERVSFADPHFRPVTVIRGPGFASAAVLSAAFAPFEPFGPAGTGELDRVAFAVDGAESSHGADPAMWRADPSGPQGPMQVSLAAALDVGGGDRFDLGQNRALGRAYLSHLYRRYGNWPDAIAAYNWGPGNLDAWITAGRPAAGLPLETERYLARVLREAGLAGGTWPFAAAPNGSPSPAPAVTMAEPHRAAGDPSCRKRSTTIPAGARAIRKAPATC